MPAVIRGGADNIRWIDSLESDSAAQPTGLVLLDTHAPKYDGEDIRANTGYVYAVGGFEQGKGPQKRGAGLLQETINVGRIFEAGLNGRSILEARMPDESPAALEDSAGGAA